MTPYEKIIHDLDNEDVYIGREGNSFTAFRGDFFDLQTSPCGFGDTEIEAIADLHEQEAVNAN